MLPTGLHRRPNGTYYLRRRIPTDLLSCYPGKKEFSRSLRTTQYSSAIQRHRKAEAELTLEWDQLRDRRADEVVTKKIDASIQISVLTPDTVATICNQFEAHTLATEEAQRLLRPYGDDELDAYERQCAEAIPKLKRDVAKGEYSAFRALLQQFLQSQRYDVQAPEEDIRRLESAYSRTYVRTQEKLLKRFRGEDEPTPTMTGSLDTPLLSTVIEKYISGYGTRKSAMLKKIRGVLPLFLDVVGDKRINMLRQADLEEFLYVVENLPPRWSDVCRTQGIKPRELAQAKVGQISMGSFNGTYRAVMTAFIKEVRRTEQDTGWPMNLTLTGRG